MKKTVLALAVMAVALPGLALAGEPVPMNDSELDSVAAGYSAELILEHRHYARALAKVEGSVRLQNIIGARLAKVHPETLAKNEEGLRKLLGPNLQHLFPVADPK